MGRTVTVVCIQCLSVLDASTPSLQILQKFEAQERVRPLIPLGTRGKLRGDLFEAIGFQVRSLTADGDEYFWREYVMFNPYKGFRYLSEYNGHWNDITAVTSTPTANEKGKRPTATHLNETYKHFQHYIATTKYVMGEFPWKVQVGETAVCDDFVSPPRLLTREQIGEDVNWSLGEYTPKETIEQNFALKEKLPTPAGILPNQPSPHYGATGKAWKRFLFWAALLTAIQIFFAVFHSNQDVFTQKYSFHPSASGEHSFVTKEFELKGRPSAVEVTLQTDLDNQWAYFNMALIESETATAFAFGRNVSYYHGSDSDGSWSEGGSKDKIILSAIPAGRYYLRIEPEMDTAQMTRGVNYEVAVKRDVTTWGFWLIGMILLLLPPIWTTIRSGSYESRRWSESDYSSGSTSTSSSDSGSDD